VQQVARVRRIYIKFGKSVWKWVVCRNSIGLLFPSKTIFRIGCKNRKYSKISIYLARVCLNKSQPRINRKNDVYNYTYTYVHTLFIDTHQNIYRKWLHYFLILVRWFYVIIDDSIYFESWFLTWIVSRNVLCKPMYIHLLFINTHVSLFLSPSILSFSVSHTISCKDNKNEQERN